MYAFVSEYVIAFRFAWGAEWAGDLDFPSQHSYPQEGERETALGSSAYKPVTDHLYCDTL